MKLSTTSHREGRAKKKSPYKEPIFNAKSKTLSHNINFLRYPICLPTKEPASEYVVETDFGSVRTIAEGKYHVQNMGPLIDGQLTNTRLPTAYEYKILCAFLSKARYNANTNVWTARLFDGKSLHRILGVEKDFNRQEAERVSEAILRLMDIKMIFDGTFYSKEYGGKLKGRMMFSLINAANMLKKPCGSWMFIVEFNNHFMDEMLVGANTPLHLPTVVRLKSPTAISLYRWLKAKFAYGWNIDREEKFSTLIKQLGIDETGQPRRLAECRNRIRAACEEINLASPSRAPKFLVEFHKQKVVFSRIPSDEWQAFNTEK